MTKKQIIINGVDVRGCKHFKIGTCLADYLLTDMNFSEAKCEQSPNCYYKQLKRKEQECEKLKKQVCGLRPELKYIIDKTCSKYNIEAKYYHEKIVEIINNLNKYKATLTEIKEIVEKEVKCAPDGETFARPEIKQILQKIDEVENDRCRSN